MKVLHINCNYLTTVLHQTMIENLTELGIENSVFAPTYNKNLSVIVPNDNVQVSECFNKWDRVIYSYKQKKIIREIEEIFEVEQYDCIHAYTLFTDGNAAMKISKKYGKPYVVAIRATDVNDFFKYRPYLIKRGIEIMKNASAVFFLSETYKKNVIDNYVPESLKEMIFQKSFIVPNGINDFWIENKLEKTNLSKLERIKNKKIRVIYVGRISKRKNIPMTQKAINILVKKGYDIEYTVVGNIDDKKEFRKIQGGFLTRYVEAQTPKELIKMYRENDIFVMNSHVETFGLVYAEAISQGIPVVYTKGQGFDGQFPEGVVGFSANDKNPEDIANSIEKVLEEYLEISKNCCKLVGNFEWSKICGKYVEIYKQIIER